MKQKGIRIFILTVIMPILLVSSVARVHADPTIDQLTNERDETQEELDEINASIEELAEEQEDVEGQIEEVKEALSQVIAQIQVLEIQLEEKEAEIQQATEDYNAAVEVEIAQYNAMVIRIQYMYEVGESSYATLLFSAQDFSDLLTKADYIEQLYDYDRRMLEQYQETRVQVAELREKLEGERLELMALETEYEQEQAYQESVIEELQAIAEDFDQQLREARNVAAQYVAEIEAQNAEIARLEEEERRRIEEERRRQEEEEARRRAEEEARRRAEEEARLAAENQQRREESEQQVSQAQETGVVTTTSQASYDVSSIYAASGSDLGKSIAVYACQFIGNPYVAGGTSLTNGADCSGFIFTIYKNFGYSIPRTSYAQRDAGREVSYDEAQPGDIICYPGHVAMYIGNGMIVHASTARTGIKVSRANYRSWLTIRRII